jgi:hypothetical protein
MKGKQIGLNINQTFDKEQKFDRVPEDPAFGTFWYSFSFSNFF